jgi:TIR domain
VKDFFISYNKADLKWAEWIAWTLEDAGYTTVFQAWDFRPGRNFVLEMHAASEGCRSTILVLSNDYLASLFTQPEWAAAFARDPTGVKRSIIPVRVRPCELPGLLRTVIYCDLIGLSRTEASGALVGAVSAAERAKPAQEPRFPGAAPEYPAVADRTPLAKGNRQPAAAREILDLLETTWTTFVAQARIRNELVERTRKRLGITEHLEYERFFQRYHGRMDEEERHLHKTIRAYTSDALSKYNRRILDILEQNPELPRAVERLSELKRHLVVWFAKFNGVFSTSPSMCLVYVGVEEKVPFPKGIEDDLQAYIGSAGGQSPASP